MLRCYLLRFIPVLFFTYSYLKTCELVERKNLRVSSSWTVLIPEIASGRVRRTDIGPVTEEAATRQRLLTSGKRPQVRLVGIQNTNN